VACRRLEEAELARDEAQRQLVAEQEHNQSTHTPPSFGHSERIHGEVFVYSECAPPGDELGGISQEGRPDEGRAGRGPRGTEERRRWVNDYEARNYPLF
jgi:hypothetical protein